MVKASDDYNIQTAVLGEQLSQWDYVCFGHWRGEVDVTGLSIRVPEERMAETLVVVRGIAGDGTPVVAFHSAVGVATAIAGAAVRVAQGTVKWKEDEYANR